LAIEGLTTLIKKSIEIGEIYGFKICRVVDECFLFCKANIMEATHLISLLEIYGVASG
jgi:hypothetical protein